MLAFINETDLKPKGKMTFAVCRAHGVLSVVIDFENFQVRYERLLPSDFFENI